MDRRVVAVGWRYAREWVKEAGRAIAGRARWAGRARPVSKLWVKTFFERRSCSASGRGEDIVESTSAPYQLLLRSIFFQEPQRAWPTEILDFGCGPGFIRLWLREAGFQGMYIGCDIDEMALSHARRDLRDVNATFVQAEGALPEVDCAIVSNVFVYNQDQEVRSVLERLAESIKSGGTLIVLEPVPAWHWEFVFDGVKLKPRSAREMEAVIAAGGFEIESNLTVALQTVRAIPILPIAYALVARCPLKK